MRFALPKAWYLVIKEFHSLLADPVLLALIVYVFTFAIYSISTGISFEVEHASVAIVDDDHSELSRRIAGALLEPYFRPAVVIDAREVDGAMDSGRFVFVIEFPPNFEADVLADKGPTIQVNVDGTAPTLAGNGNVYLQSIISREVASFVSRDSGTVHQPINLVSRAKFNPNYRSVWFTAIMQVINNISILSIILTGAALIREREHGTIEHLLVMPVTPMEIMLSKIIANGFVIICAAVLSLFLVVQGLLHVPITGSVGLFIFGAILFEFSVTALGILIATYVNTMGQFGLLSVPVIVILYLLSGGVTPLETMPIWLQNIMRFTPNTQFVSFAQATLYRGAGLEIVWPQLAALVAIGMVTLLICLLRFRKVVSST
ncbi:ABC transporter permease [Methylocystis sp. SC2]|uniref:ABC transporter permease n=1 Tax=Methylocystis sp. (strain SC2) TaxID=187303 RepID=UPI00027AE870|nr:ABC transporter permease [Methylocystis sp. SC2]CCJ07330.1 ABC-2 type transporter [Methylocystis sp. SC2]